MTTYTIINATGEQMAKRMLALAWDAAGVYGYGAFQDRPDAKEVDVWDCMASARDYGGLEHKRPKSGEVDADYLFGRMMKLNFSFGDNTVSGHVRQWNHDYQSFCHRYKDFDALVNAAAVSLGATVVKEGVEVEAPSK